MIKVFIDRDEHYPCYDIHINKDEAYDYEELEITEAELKEIKEVLEKYDKIQEKLDNMFSNKRDNTI